MRLNHTSRVGGASLAVDPITGGQALVRVWDNASPLVPCLAWAGRMETWLAALTAGKGCLRVKAGAVWARFTLTPCPPPFEGGVRIEVEGSDGHIGGHAVFNLSRCERDRLVEFCDGAAEKGRPVWDI